MGLITGCLEWAHHLSARLMAGDVNVRRDVQSWAGDGRKPC